MYCVSSMLKNIRLNYIPIALKFLPKQVLFGLVIVINAMSGFAEGNNAISREFQLKTAYLFHLA